MNPSEKSATSPTEQSRHSGLMLAIALSLALLVVTAYQSLATFFIRMHSSDVMLGAVGNITLTSRATLDIAIFVAGVVLIHFLLALVVYGLAYLTSIVWPQGGRSRSGLVVLWFALLLAAILLQNAEWFPRSNAGSYYHGVAISKVGTVTVARLAVLLMTGAAAIILLMAVLKAARSSLRAPVKLVMAAGFGLALVVGAIGALLDGRGAIASETVSAERPNVIILGIDSLRLEYLSRFGGTGVTPNLDTVLRDADLFRDTTTPLARTFPSWMAILTGKAPLSTGANFNLVHRTSVRSEPTIADLFSAAGYTTFFATDEVRFSNIDESYGFNHIITPPIGAADFLIGRTADLPLSNVLANSPIGSLLLNYLHGNRAVANLYRPTTYLSRLRREFNPRGPVFAAIHLTAAHWPYFHADTPLELDAHESEPGAEYSEAVKTADAMLGEAVRILRSKGVLDNAIVIVLSDHGEAFNLPTDTLVGEELDGRIDGLLAPTRVVNWGHGQSVLSPAQFQVLLAFQSYGPVAGFTADGRDLSVPASLTDVLPTVLDLLDWKWPPVSGISLAPWLRGDAVSPGQAAERVRFTETDIRVAPTEGGAIDEDEVAAHAIRLFAVDPKSGWLHLREEAMPSLMQFKERAAIGSTQILAAMPVAPDRHQFLLLDRSTGVGRVLAEPPPDADTEATRLWNALHEHYDGALHPPIVVRPEDQPRIAAQWAALAETSATVQANN